MRPTPWLVLHPAAPLMAAGENQEAHEAAPGAAADDGAHGRNPTPLLSARAWMVASSTADRHFRVAAALSLRFTALSTAFAGVSRVDVPGRESAQQSITDRATHPSTQSQQMFAVSSRT